MPISNFHNQVKLLSIKSVITIHLYSCMIDDYIKHVIKRKYIKVSGGCSWCLQLHAEGQRFLYTLSSIIDMCTNTLGLGHSTLWSNRKSGLTQSWYTAKLSKCLHIGRAKVGKVFE